jgi:hypothetical protein
MSLGIHYFSGLLCRDSSLNSSSKLVEIDRFNKQKAKALGFGVNHHPFTWVGLLCSFTLIDGPLGLVFGRGWIAGTVKAGFPLATLQDE